MVKSIQLWLHRHYKELRFWFAVLLALMIIFLLFKAIDATKEQSVERDTAVQTVLNDLDRRTRDINNNTNMQTNLLRTQNDLLACLLVVHDLEIDVSPEDRARCEQSVRNGFSPAPSAVTGNEAPQTSASGGAGNPSEQPPQDGVTIDLPLLPPIHIPSPF